MYVAGLVEAGAGTLDLAGALTGPGALMIDAGAALQLDSSVAGTLSVDFAGASATLALANPAGFAGVIAGLAASDTIDLLGRAATSASVNASDQLVIVNGSTTLATLQLTGNYSGATFQVGSDGQGGTSVTLLSAARHPPPVAAAAIAGPQAFIAAMAAHGAGRGSAPVGPAHFDRAQLVALAPPRHS